MGAAETRDERVEIVTITVTPTMFKALVREAIREELGKLDQPRDILSTAEVAELLGQTPGNIRNLVRRKGMPHMVVGREHRFRRNEVLAWAEQRARR